MQPEQTSPERIPPNDLDAERSVIGAILLATDKVFPLVSDLAVDDFFLPCHREAWAAILAVLERRMPVDVISVGDELQARGVASRFDGGWMVWASTAANAIPTVTNVGHYAGIVKDKATLRRFIELSAEVSGAAYGSQPVEDVITRAREGVAKLEATGRGVGPEKIGNLLAGVVDAIQARSERKESPGVVIRVRALADVITSWNPGKLYIVGGRPGDGKTAFAAQSALHAAEAGFPVLFFSREMMAAELVERNLSHVSRVPAYSIGSGRLSKSEWSCIQDAGNTLLPVPLWYDDRTSTIEGIAATSRKWHAIEVRGRKGERHLGSDGNPLGMIVLDYLQLARVTKAKAGSNREQVVAEMSRTMKELALELKCPVMVLSQLNREAEKRGGRPIISDLRESGAIEQDADVILFVYRDIPPEDIAGRREPGESELIIGKHRGGPTGIAKTWITPPLMEFTDRDTYTPPARDTQVEPPPNWHDRDF